MNYVKHIDKNNKALEFIDLRISDDNYRGEKSSQHNRYKMEHIVTLLSLLNKHAPNKTLMQIRTTDLTKRLINIENELIYSLFCRDVKKETGRGTQDSIRKNLFVDIHRMGLIDRYDKNKDLIKPWKQGLAKYVSLTDHGMKLVKEENILNKYFIYSKAIDKLLGGYINVILDILRNTEYGIKKINFYEFMFFISSIGVGSSFKKTTKECIELIKEYRILPMVQRKSVLEILKNRLKPENYTGSKKDQRDFHNWVNKVEQIFSLLEQTVYFDRNGDNLFLKEKEIVLGGESFNKRLNRSVNEKEKYFNNHCIRDKVSGFELHHIIPLSWSESAEQFELFDKWENMIYIDGYSHAQVTQNKNKNVVVKSNCEDLILKDFEGTEVYLKFQKNVSYLVSKQNIILKYNLNLLETV